MNTPNLPAMLAGRVLAIAIAAATAVIWFHAFAPTPRIGPHIRPVAMPSLSAATSWAAQPDQAEQSPDELPEAILTFFDGRTLRGLLVSRDDKLIVIRIDTIDNPIPTEQVQQLRFLPSVMDRYRSLRDSIEPGDAESLVLLAAWLRSVDKLELALATVDEALTLEPHHQRGVRLRRWLVSQLDLRSKRLPKADRTRPDAPDVVEPPKREFPIISPADVALMRVYEVDLSVSQRIVINRGTIERLMTDYARSDLIPATTAGRNALLRQPPYKVLELMFRLQARHLYHEVKILDNPPALALFKERIHGRRGWLINACASNRCHGGEYAGRLWLANKKHNSDQAAFTNMLILERFTLADGTPLINLAEPVRSPLLHYATRRDNALFKHPEVGERAGSRGWRPIFKSTEDLRFRQAVEWINALYRPRPDYGIDYTPPVPVGLLPPDAPPADDIDR